MGFAYTNIKTSTPSMSGFSSNSVDVNFQSIDVNDIEVLDGVSDDKITVPISTYNKSSSSDFNNTSDVVSVPIETYNFNTQNKVEVNDNDSKISVPISTYNKSSSSDFNNTSDVVSVPVETYNFNTQNNVDIDDNETKISVPLSAYNNTNSNEKISNKYSNHHRVTDSEIKKEMNKEFLKVGATVVTFVFSTAEGILNVAEGIYDSASVVVAGITTPFTLLGDGILKLSGKETHLTNDLWDATKAHVSKRVVTDAADDFYNNNSFGKFLRDNAYAFNGTRSVGNTFGYVGGVIVASMLTAGVGTASLSGGVGGFLASASEVPTLTYAGVAGTVGFGEGAQEAWKSGSTVPQGLGVAALNGGLDAAQWGLGAKIGKTQFFSKTKALKSKPIAQKLVSGGTKSLLAGFIGASDIPANSGIQTLYNNNDYVTNFDANGGVEGVVIDGAIASTFMAGSTAFNYKVASKNSKVEMELNGDTEEVYKMIENSPMSDEYVESATSFQDTKLGDFLKEYRKKATKSVVEDTEDEIEKEIR